MRVENAVNLGKDLRRSCRRNDLMEAEDLWGARWTSSANPLAHRYMETAARKQTLVCLAADMRSVGELIDLVEEVGPYIAALKTHVDMVDDLSLIHI